MLIRLLLLSLLSWGIFASQGVAQSGTKKTEGSKLARPQSSATSAGKVPPVFHEVRKGETLWSISQEYGKSVGEMMDANRMKDDKVWQGLKLRIPQADQDEPSPSPAGASSNKPVDDGKTRYVVVAGNTFSGIASRHGITMKALQAANPEAVPTRLQIGQKLIIPPKAVKPPAPASVEEKKASAPAPTFTEHVVGDRETFYSIAKKFGVSTQQMVDANPNIRPERLRKGLKVVVPIPAKVPASEAAAEAPVEEKKAPIVPNPKFVGSSKSQRLHVVQKGENFYSISRLYQVSVDDLKVQNRLTSRDVLKEGDQLIVPPTQEKP